jgi:[ribosomal protein S18]-alanine N-acetyltransferase
VRTAAVGYVVTLDVVPVWRRRGVATRLMEAAEVRVAAAGATRMALHVFAGNADAIRFYERLGYVRAGVRGGFYGRDLDALELQKLL